MLGIFVGLALGLALAAGIAWTLVGGRASAPAKSESPIAARDAKAAKPESPDKPRFEFYKILPGAEEPKLAIEKKGPDRPAAAKATVQVQGKGAETPKSAEAGAENVASAEPFRAKAAQPGDRFWLQAGSFAQESDAENMKARLALAGWEAQVQSGTLADKTVRYRVRMGPYDNTEELNRIKGQLLQRGFEVAVIKF